MGTVGCCVYQGGVVPMVHRCTRVTGTSAGQVKGESESSDGDCTPDFGFPADLWWHGVRHQSGDLGTDSRDGCYRGPGLGLVCLLCVVVPS